MRIVHVALTALIVAGCSQTETTTIQTNEIVTAENSNAPAAWTGFEPGNYVVTAADGKKTEFTLNADGSYSSKDAAGKVETGALAMKDGKGCFTPAGGKELCWTNAAPGADGSWAATADDGAKVTVMKDLIKETTWEYIHPESKKLVQESVDANGAFVTLDGKERVDHGTVVMKAGKACFTSAVKKEGESCWSDPKLAVGQSGETVSDKGEKLAIKRLAYVPVPAS